VDKFTDSKDRMSQLYYTLRNWESQIVTKIQSLILTQTALPYIHFSKKITKTNRYYIYLGGLLFFDITIFWKTVVIFYLSRFLTLILKNYLKQPRPYNSYNEIRYLSKPKTSYSFPSQSMVSAVIVYHSYRRIGLGWISDYYFGFIMMLLSITRIYRGLHYPHDMIVSLALGYLVERTVLSTITIIAGLICVGQLILTPCRSSSD